MNRFKKFKSTLLFQLPILVVLILFFDTLKKSWKNHPIYTWRAFVWTCVFYLISLGLYLLVRKVVKRFILKPLLSKIVVGVVFIIVFFAGILSIQNIDLICIEKSHFPFGLLQCVEKESPDSSFPIGTLVLTPNGMRAIETIKVGDEIISFDIERQEKVVSKVERIFAKKVTDFIRINNQLETTSKHPFALVDVDDKNKVIWRNADHLKIGDCMVVAKNHCERIEKLNQFDSEKPVEVFNLQVSGNENYFVKVGDVYVLVHNKQYIY